jgi:hypothetical protein
MCSKLACALGACASGTCLHTPNLYNGGINSAQTCAIGIVLYIFILGAQKND